MKDEDINRLVVFLHDLIGTDENTAKYLIKKEVKIYLKLAHSSLLEKIEGLRKGFRHGVNSVPEGDGCVACGEIRGYNQALDDIKEVL